MDADSIDQRKLPFTEHNGIWDFYEEIDYDYKKKRYVKNTSDRYTLQNRK